ncbi:MAG: hypothetical protein JXA54_04300 [Candidatus Heimdallarchaeota archaeon]|nr:hypothetical protein [Candidatus Heimdallarchaeota archaeon]
MNKLGLLALPFILFSATGLVLLFTTPVVSANIHVVDSGLNHDYKLSANLVYNGSTVLILKGEVAGSIEDEKTVIYRIDDYSSVPNMVDYPNALVYVNIVGIASVVLGALLSIFGGVPAMVVIGGLIGFAGAAICVSANCILLEFIEVWKTEIGEPVIGIITLFTTGTVMSPTYNSFNAGWFGPIIGSGLGALGLMTIALVSVTRHSKSKY